jgi:phage replication O-like protein O
MTRKIRPFEPKDEKYTIVDNVIFDYIMPTLSPNAWKVLCLILRKTRGWHKEWDGLAYSQIKEGTGIKSDPTVNKALTELLGKEYIRQVKGDKWDAAQYALNVTIEIEVENGATIETTAEPTIENEVGSTIESKDTKQTMKQRKKKKEARAKTPPAVHTFREAAHRYPAKSWYTDIDEIVGCDPPDLEFWHEVVKQYVGLGWNPTNVKNMLEFYQKREIPKQNGNGGKHASPNNRRTQRGVPKYSVADPAGFHDQSQDAAGA